MRVRRTMFIQSVNPVNADCSFLHKQDDPFRPEMTFLSRINVFPIMTTEEPPVYTDCISGSEPVHGATHTLTPFVQHVSINHGRVDILVAHQFLDRPDIVPALK